jgi:hypothetical protein
MATINAADVYGTRSAAGASIGTSVGVQVTGPNQSAVTTAAQGNAVTNVGGNAGSAFSWVGFVLALVILRVALEAGGESR